MRRAGLALMVVAALAVAVALLWPSGDPADAGADAKAAKPKPKAPAFYVNENGEAAPPPELVGDGGRPRGVRVRLVGPDGPVREGMANLFLASGPSHHGRRLAAARGSPDADGWVTFTRVPGPDDEPQLAVWAPFFEVHQGPFTDGETVTLVPLAPVRGRVVFADQRPAPGAQVGNEDEPYVKTVTDGSGAFELKVPVRGALLAEREGMSARVDRIPPQGEVVLVLGEGLKVDGFVTGRDGRPLAAVQVLLRAGALSRTVQTGDDGRWSATVLRIGRGAIRYEKEGYHPVSESPLELSQRRGAPLVMSRPSTIVGTLVAADGAPVPHTLVTASGLLPQTTDEAGAFTFEDVAEPEVTLEADPEDVLDPDLLEGEAETPAAEGVAQKVVAVPEGTTVTVTLMFPPKLIPVPLDVVDAIGEPNFGWDAVATPIPAKGWESHASYGAGAGLGLMQGRFQIAVRDVERELSGGTTIDASPAVDARPIRIVLYGADGGRGKRLPGDRDPIAKVKVAVVTPSGSPAVNARLECGGVPGRSLGQGEFECPFYEDEAGAVVVTAEADGAQASAPVSLGDKGVKLVVRPNRIIEGRITGTLPAQAYLEINSTAAMDEEEITGSTFRFEHMPAVRTIVCVVAGTVAAGTDEPVPRGCAVAQADGDARLEIPLGAPAKLSLAVVDEHGKPVPDPILYLDRRGIRPLAPDGKAALDVAPGTHVLVVNATGSKARAELQFQAKPGTPVELGTIRLIR